MKKFLTILFASLLVLFSFGSCRYDVPEGYKSKHFTHAEALAYAKKIDPNATVSQKYVEYKGNSYFVGSYREWEATLFGIECHVASAARVVSDQSGEFPEIYYDMDNDYDYYVIAKYIEENGLDYVLEMSYDLSKRYKDYDECDIFPFFAEKRELSKEELESVLQTMIKCRQECSFFSETLIFDVNFWVPKIVLDYYGQESYITFREYSFFWFSNTTKEEIIQKYQEEFIPGYQEQWNLIGNADLPIVYC